MRGELFDSSLVLALELASTRKMSDGFQFLQRDGGMNFYTDDLHHIPSLRCIRVGSRLRENAEKN